MPVYEYRCYACNTQFDLRQKFSDPPADKCPKCGSAVRKLVSAASFSLKGGGWYGDGYGNKAEPAKYEGDAAVGTEVATTEGASTDTTPASSETTPSLASAAAQTETKSTAAETPATTKDKTEVKSQVSVNESSG